MFSCRTNVAVTFVVVNEFVVVKSRVAIAAITLMADTRCYAVFVKMLVILSDAVGFVGCDSLDFCVGILEIVSEFSKILSFSFRLFGNIFAGSVMLFIIGSLVPVLAQVIFLGLELFVGLIQAFVFGMLTMVFMTQATVGHGDHGDEHAH